VIELEEEDGDKGPFLGWGNGRRGALNVGWKNGVNRPDPGEHYVDRPDTGHDGPAFTLENNLDW
jgi:hypothetical protein